RLEVVGAVERRGVGVARQRRDALAGCLLLLMGGQRARDPLGAERGVSAHLRFSRSRRPSDSPATPATSSRRLVASIESPSSSASTRATALFSTRIAAMATSPAGGTFIAASRGA